MWTGKEPVRACLLAALLAVTAAWWWHVHRLVSDCEAKGGQRLRGTWIWQGGQCHDASTLKVVR